MPEMHLSGPGSTCSACGPFTKSKERIQKFKFKKYLSKKRSCFNSLQVFWSKVFWWCYCTKHGITGRNGLTKC